MSDKVRVFVHFAVLRKTIECEMSAGVSLNQNIHALYEMLKEEDHDMYNLGQYLVYEFHTHTRCDPDVSLKAQGITSGTRLLVY